MKRYSISVLVGYESRTVTLTADELERVRAGSCLTKTVEDYYEGELFTYVFQFNRHFPHALVVTYEDAVGFDGTLEDAYVELIGDEDGAPEPAAS